MQRINVRTARPYEVMIGAGLLQQMQALLPEATVRKGRQGGKAVLITDRHVDPLYGAKVERLLAEMGFVVIKAVTPAGESAKSGEWYLRLLSLMAQQHVSRSDTIFALGGGVIGDLSGFLAATFLRGIDFVQLPTTLLAAVDSSVGGKTAINLPEGKNLVGAFYQPVAVIMDTDTLKTLEDEVFCDGCAEIIKYAMIWDEGLFARLAARVLPLAENRADQALLEEIIARCVAIKEEVVSQDEKDQGLRNLLNFGHTIGHSIEKNSGFQVSHGKAVAMGMVIATQAAERAGICADGCTEKLQALLLAYGLPVKTDYSAEALREGMLSDKKIDGKGIHLILPRRIGKCKIENMQVCDLAAFLLQE